MVKSLDLGGEALNALCGVTFQLRGALFTFSFSFQSWLSETTVTCLFSTLLEDEFCAIMKPAPCIVFPGAII